LTQEGERYRNHAFLIKKMLSQIAKNSEQTKAPLSQPSGTPQADSVKGFFVLDNV
jgi:hypothetical protein